MGVKSGVLVLCGLMLSAASPAQGGSDCADRVLATAHGAAALFDGNVAAAKRVSGEKLRTRLLIGAARQADQAIQRVLVEAMTKCSMLTDGERFGSLLILYKGVSDTAQAELKRILATSGWPVISTYGEDIDHSAFLIVQHADMDPAFQEEVLPLLEALAQQGESSKENYALLFDRVAIASGRPQRYGSQGECKGKRFDLHPTEPGDLDVRRKAMGLNPIRVYRRNVETTFCAGQG